MPSYKPPLPPLLPKYGKLTVLGPVAGKPKMHCQCECGKKLEVTVYALRSFNAKQCNQCRINSTRNHLTRSRELNDAQKQDRQSCKIAE